MYAIRSYYDGCLGNDGEFMIAGEVENENRCDLDALDRQLGQVEERGVAGAELINGQMQAADLEVGQGRQSHGLRANVGGSRLRWNDLGRREIFRRLFVV